MKKIIGQIINIIISVLSAFWVTVCFANFGESCSIPPRSTIDNYLIENTAYGYILNNIDMKTHVADACTIRGNTFKFCLKNPAGAATPCTIIVKGVGDSFTLGSITTNPDLIKPSITDIQLTVNTIDNDICLTMPTSRGEVPLVCRDNGTSTGADLGGSETCRPIAASCYDGNSKSQSLLNFSGLTIQCMRDTLDQVFFNYNSCTPSEDELPLTTLNAFPAFQEALKVAIRGALILYVVIYGFKLAMSGEFAQLNKVAIFIIKFLAISYFAVGLGPLYFEYGRQTQHNGMTETVLPILVQLMSDFAEIVFLSGGSQGLCVFDSAKYENGYEYYKLWDAIDCRIGYYLGMQLLYNIGGFLRDASSVIPVEVGSVINLTTGNGEAIEAINSLSNLSFFTAMFGFFLAGNLIIVICGLVFVIIFCSIILYFLTAYLVATVTLYVMAYISPIFITMALFERTKSYFDSWMRILLSCTLQPAVIGGFVALILTMYDGAIYGNCEFQRYDYTLSEFKFSTFELRLPNSEPEKCENSAGYKLLKYYTGEGWEKHYLIVFVIRSIKDVFDLGVNIVYVLVFSFIFYYFIQSINEFVSDLTSGPSMAGVTASPIKIIDAAIRGAKKIRDGRQSKIPKPDDKDGKGEKSRDNGKNSGGKFSPEGGKSGGGGMAAGEGKEGKGAVGNSMSGDMKGGGK